LGVWKAVGFSDHGGSDEAARKRALSLEEGSFLARVMEGTPCRLEKGNDVSARLGCGDAARAVLIPMVVKEKISGAVYADCAPGEEEQFDSEAIGLLTFVAGLMVDRLASRKLKPAPALRSLDAVSGPATAATPPPASSYGTKMMELPPEVEAAPPPPPPVDTAPEPRGWATPAPAPRPHFVEPVPDSSRPSSVTPMPAEESFGAPEEAEAPAEAPSPLSAPRSSVGIRRLAGPLARATGDERREEARRFAKLLVSEVKLYNERAVLEGREHGNIYERLKEDIDRSRQMYDERIPEDVRASSNFFHEELVRILVNGRVEALGI